MVFKEGLFVAQDLDGLVLVRGAQQLLGDELLEVGDSRQRRAADELPVELALQV